MNPHTVTVSCADLHVHSKYSNRPSEWFLRRIGAPESFVEPRALYERLRARGMQFVTITDHNTLHGALEIADLPGTFLSSELTTYFPEDGCKIHCLVWGVTETQFADLLQAREDIYALRDLLVREAIPHAIAHPLFRINDRLTAVHVEKLLVLFNHFEAINGMRDPRAGTLLRSVLHNLTADDIAALANRYRLTPTGPAPWVKSLYGGSDDHSGLYAGCAYTRTPRSDSAQEFLQHLRDGRTEPGGRGGSSLRLAHSLYHIAYEYYRSRFLQGAADRTVLGAILRRLAVGAPEPTERSEPIGANISSVWAPIRRIARRWQRRRLSDLERLLVDEIEALLHRESDVEVGHPIPTPDSDDRKFATAAKIAHQLIFAFASRAIEHVRFGRWIEALQSASAMGPVLLGISPYLTAFAAQHKDETFLRNVADRFTVTPNGRPNSTRRLWVTDTFDDLNGVARTIQTLAELAARTDRPITVLTSRTTTPKTTFPLQNFAPVGSFTLPEYPHQSLSVPPVLDMLAWIEAQGFDELIISTPGPVGLVGRLAGTLFGLRVRGVYHTDFPRYLRQWTEDDLVAEWAWRFMQWFYGNMERIYVPSRTYLEQLVAAGFARERLVVLPRGVDTHRFRPDRRSEEFWKSYGVNGSLKFLYVGRVSEEKNLRALIEAYTALVQSRRGDTALIIVGDGPAREDLQRWARHPSIVFTGPVFGDALATAYASADVFVFPSLTDTFGNVVLEAHASGLPAIVTNQGGPREIVSAYGSGLVTEGDPASLLAAMCRMRDDPELRETLRARALACARRSRWEEVLAVLEDSNSAESPGSLQADRTEPRSARLIAVPV